MPSLRHGMALNLTPSQHEVLQHMITNGSLEEEAMADITKCSSRTIRTLRANLCRYGSTITPTTAEADDLEPLLLLC